MLFFLLNAAFIKITIIFFPFVLSNIFEIFFSSKVACEQALCLGKKGLFTSYQ